MEIQEATKPQQETPDVEIQEVTKPQQETPEVEIQEASEIETENYSQTPTMASRAVEEVKEMPPPPAELPSGGSQDDEHEEAISPRTQASCSTHDGFFNLKPLQGRWGDVSDSKNLAGVPWIGVT